MFRFGVKNRGFGFRVALALGIAFATILAATPAQAYIAVARTTYIVQVKLGTADSVRAAIGKLGETPHDELTEVMDGFVLDLTEIEAATLRADANVIQVVADQSMSLLDTQNPTPSWGLDRVDQDSTTYDNTYNYPASAGAGVRVYVVDTGVNANDPDFAGRITTGVDIMGQNLQGADCNGHGTHVAGTVAGTKYGVAKKATIVPIRVLGCTGSGSMSSIVSAVDWIIANHPAGTPGVMSASIGGSKYQLVNDAIEKLYQAGITPVIAAGNNNADAAGYSPASSPNAITVGASDSNDTRAYFSNFGDLVDVFAPGVNIVSNNYLDPSTGRSLNGTSMATPHVSGLAALYLADHPTATPSDVTAAIKAGAQAGKIVDAKSANGNYLMNIKFTNAALPPVGAPTAVTASAVTSTGATISWTAPAGTQAANSYKVEYRESSATTWSSVDSTTTSAVLSGLISNSTYSVRVLSIAGDVTSPASDELIFSTLGDVPAAPTNLRTTSVYGSQISIAWNAPETANGSVLTGYQVWLETAGVWEQKLTTKATIANLMSLQPSTAYSIRIIATNAIGASPASNVISVTTTTATPTMVAMTTRSNLTATGITINWNTVAPIDPSTPITYSVAVTNTSNNALVGTYTVSTNSITLSALTRYTIYSVVVTAMSGTIAGPPSNPYTFRTLADVPTAPTNVYYNKLGTDQVTLYWSPPRDGGGVALTGYKVEQFVAGVWTLVASPALSVNSLVVPAPAPGLTEQYRVSATNSVGTGLTAQIAVLGTYALPQSPTGLTLVPSTTSAGNGLLSWIAPTDNGGTPVTSYTVYRRVTATAGWTTVSSGVTGLSSSVVLPPKGATYEYSVAAVTIAGSSSKSLAFSYTTAATVPAAPNAAALAWNTDGTLRVSWNAPGDNGGSAITSYKVQRLVSSAWETVVTATTNSASLARDAIGATYSIRIIAVNSIGDSLPSAVSNITVPAAKASAPLNLTATTIANSRVTLAWQAPANNGGGTIIGYGIQYSANTATWWSLTSTAALTVTLAMPPKGATYQYRVYAISSAGNSEASNVVTVSRETTAPGAPRTRSLSFAADTNMVASWYAPSDNGGSAITGYRVEYSTNGANFTTHSTVAATVLSVSIAREAPGVRAYVRVFAISALGESPASSTMILQTPFLKASAPGSFTAADNGSVVVLAWAAPSNLGGSPFVTYSPQVSSNNGTTWSRITTVSSLSANVPRPPKGLTYKYRVVANTAFGDSEPSEAVSITVAPTVAAAPRFIFAGYSANGSIDIRWAAPSDNGGSAISSYVVEKSYDLTTWTNIATVAASSPLALIVARENAGVRVHFRVAAINATATSAFSTPVTMTMPVAQASAPQNFVAQDNGRVVSTSWSAPANLGGATSATYTVQASKDGGATWQALARISGFAIQVARPAKGTTWQYRVVATTQFGLGQASNSVAITAETTAPSSPSITSLALNTSTSKIDLRWYAPSDNGGSAITGYLVQKSLDNQNWSTIANPEASVLALSIDRDAAGVRSYYRVSALTAIAASPYSSAAVIQMPFAKPATPQNFAVTDNGSYVVATWSPVADRGGSSYLYYYVQASNNGGSTWNIVASSSSTTANLTRPAKGTSRLYRVATFTAYGYGDFSQSIQVTAAITVPGVPSIRSFAFNADQTSTLTFNGPSDNGGTAITGYIVEQSTNGTTWAQSTTLGAAGGPVQIAKQDPGVRLYVRVIAVNSVGNSQASAAYALQTPYVQASEVRNLASVSTASYVALSWAAPTYLGGATSTFGYQIEGSTDGVNWLRIATASSLNYNISKPAKGTTLNYRVRAITSWGLGLPSNTVSATSATTVTSSVTNVVVTRLSSGEFNISFRQPYDLGGISTWSYKLQQGLNGNYTTVQTGAGSAVNNLTVPSPAANVYVYYRIIATNSVGDSSTYTLLIRG